MNKRITSLSICQVCSKSIEALTLIDLASACLDHVAEHEEKPPISIIPYFTYYVKLSEGVEIAGYRWGQPQP